MGLGMIEAARFTPPTFAEGLKNWSSGDGVAGDHRYDLSSDASLVTGDSDFGVCLELRKSIEVQKLRSFTQTPILKETYLRIRCRVKVVSGHFPGVRIAGWAGAASGAHIAQVTQIGPSVVPTDYSQLLNVSAIIGPGLRDGVDMVWGTDPDYGHFGLDLTGQNGGIIRIESLQIEDVSALFMLHSTNILDIRDYGAIGDGETPNYDAFTAADDAAAGRRLLVPEGQFYIEKGLTLRSKLLFRGTVKLPVSAPFVLQNNFDFTTYIDAFGEEELAFKKAFQALLNSGDHDALDLGGRTIGVNAPIDLQEAVSTRQGYAVRRVIRNGELYARRNTAWENDIVISRGTYSPSDPKKLRNLNNSANIQAGSLVEGNGVGREIYVTSVDINTSEATLSEALYDAEGTQDFTFTRFKYMLDFSGFDQLQKFMLQNVNLKCNSIANGIMLARAGDTFHIADCVITKPRYRGLTSTGWGCQGMLIDRCHFITAESLLAAQDRVSIALNANANDIKLRDNRASRFRHFAILSGSNSIISGNHFYQGDERSNGIRLARIALTQTNTTSTITGNYVDNYFIEWTNEHDAKPDYTTGFGFSALTISDNIFLCSNVAPSFSFLVLKPYGQRHGLSDLSVNGNNFRAINGSIDRIEAVDTSLSDLDRERFFQIQFHGNNFNNITTQSANPLRLTHHQNSAATLWTIDTAQRLPFQAQCLDADTLIAKSPILTPSGARRHALPYIELQYGSDKDQAAIVWPEAVKGKLGLQLRCDR